MHGRICRFLIAFGALLLAVLAPRVAHAQAPVDIFELEYEYDPPSPIQDPEGANQEHLEIQTSTLNTSLVYPILFENGAIWANGVAYSLTHARYKNWDDATGFLPEDDLPTDFHKLQVQSMVNYHFAEHWSALALAAPGLYSDFADISGEDVGLLAYALVQWHPNYDTIVGAGGMYSDLFGEPLFLPALKFFWTDRDDVYFDVLLPQRVTGYWMNSWIEVGGRLEVSGQTFRLSEDPDTFDSGFLRYSSIYGGPDVHIRLTQKLWLNLTAGRVVARRFEFYDSGNDEIESFNLENDWSARIGLTFRANRIRYTRPGM